MKMYAVVINEALEGMGKNRGKIAAQCGHAFVACAVNCMERDAKRWKEYNDSDYHGKVVLKADMEEAQTIMEELKSKKVPFQLIRDAGLTVFEGPTNTVLGIGPIRDNECSATLKGLKLLR